MPGCGKKLAARPGFSIQRSQGGWSCAGVFLVVRQFAVILRQTAFSAPIMNRKSPLPLAENLSFWSDDKLVCYHKKFKL